MSRAEESKAEGYRLIQSGPRSKDYLLRRSQCRNIVTMLTFTRVFTHLFYLFLENKLDLVALERSGLLFFVVVVVVVVVVVGGILVV